MSDEKVIELSAHTRQLDGPESIDLEMVFASTKFIVEGMALVGDDINPMFHVVHHDRVGNYKETVIVPNDWVRGRGADITVLIAESLIEKTGAVKVDSAVFVSDSFVAIVRNQEEMEAALDTYGSVSAMPDRVEALSFLYKETEDTPTEMWSIPYTRDTDDNRIYEEPTLDTAVPIEGDMPAILMEAVELLNKGGDK
jgi:hypothetical protein